MVECSPATRAARVRFPADAFSIHYSFEADIPDIPNRKLVRNRIALCFTRSSAWRRFYSYSPDILTRYKKNSSYFDMDWNVCPIIFLIWGGFGYNFTEVGWNRG